MKLIGRKRSCEIRSYIEDWTFLKGSGSFLIFEKKALGKILGKFLLPIFQVILLMYKYSLMNPVFWRRITLTQHTKYIHTHTHNILAEPKNPKSWPGIIE
jgi:hypothetical protein